MGPSRRRADAALQIAAAANARVRAEHTTSNRLGRIVEFALSLVSQRTQVVIAQAYLCEIE